MKILLLIYAFALSATCAIAQFPPPLPPPPPGSIVPPPPGPGPPPIASLAPPAFYQFTATGGQVVPGPGAVAPAALNLTLALSGTGFAPVVTVLGTGAGVPGVTQVALRGPATATTTGPVLLVLPFTQPIGGTLNLSFAPQVISVATQNLITSGQVYVEVSSAAFPSGALRGVVATNRVLCSPLPPLITPCSQCPCGNATFPLTGGGCDHSQGGSALLSAFGVGALSADSLNFWVTGAVSNSVALLTSGSATLPLAGSPTPCPTGTGLSGGQTDGLRCVGGQMLRHGVRLTDANGATVFGAYVPPGGFLAANGFMAGQTRVFQATYRDSAASPCGTGLNTSNAVLLSFVL